MKISSEVSNYFILGAITAGVEGGINYWARIKSGYRAVAACWPVEDSPGEDAIGAAFATWMDSGAAVVIIDAEDDGKEYRLDKAAIERGLTLMAEKQPRHFANLVRDSGDAETGDVLIQYCVLGDLVYG